MLKRTMDLTVYIEHGDEEFKCDARVNYWPEDPGRFSGPPEHCYPPEPADLDIVSEKWYPYAPVLSEEQEDDLHETLMQAAADCYADEEDRRADMYWDAKKDREYDYEADDRAFDVSREDRYFGR